MHDVLLIVGHQPWAKGAANMGGPDPSDDVYEYDFNLPLVQAVEAGLGFLGVNAQMDVYTRGGGNVSRWSGKSRLLVEFHCNAFNGKASGTEVLFAAGSAPGRRAALAVQAELVAELGLPDRGVKSRTRNNRGGYLLHGVAQPAIIPEPFFIDRTADLRRAESRNLAAAYVRGIAEALEAM